MCGNNSLRTQSFVTRLNLVLIFQVFPEDIRAIIATHPERGSLLEVVLDLGRRPEARFQGATKVEFLRDAEITAEELVVSVGNLSDFGGDNRAGIEGTLHRISCMRNRRGGIVRPVLP
eukprot:295383-Prorocentrum_minimum.AAC.5